MSTETQDPLIGSIVAGRYRVVKPLGEGGMGQVYLAIHDAIEKKIALKVLKPEYSAKEDILTRFQQEAISASRIKHPNVLEVFDFGMLDNGCAFLAMEFLQGNDIADELVRHGSLEPPRAIRIILQVCRALAAAHKAGVVHRDMKPDNIFLLRTGDGEEIVKIVDFGIAQLRNPDEEAKSDAKPRRRLTKTGMIFGTPEYMAPEQAAGKKADLRVDVYATGIILFEMLTGAVPFTGDSFMAVLAAHLNDPAPSMMEFRPDLDISKELHDVVRRTLAKKPEDRYQSMIELSQAILATPEGAMMQSQGEVPLSVMHPVSSIPPTPGAMTAAQFREPNPTSAVPVQSQHSIAVAHTGSHTLGASTTTGPQPVQKKSGVGVLVGSVAAFLLIGGGAAAYLGPKLLASGSTPRLATSQPEQESTPTATAPPIEPSAEIATAQSATSPVQSAVPTVTTVTEPPKVKISIETSPAGAKLTKDGFQVCAETPCELQVDPGAELELVATLGARRGSSKVLALKDQTVTIALRAPVVKKKAPTGRRMCEARDPATGMITLKPCD